MTKFLTSFRGQFISLHFVQILKDKLLNLILHFRSLKGLRPIRLEYAWDIFHKKVFVRFFLVIIDLIYELDRIAYVDMDHAPRRFMDDR